MSFPQDAPFPPPVAAPQLPELTRLAEIPALFHEMLESIQRYSAQASQVIRGELEALSRFIAEANAEITAVRPNEICDLHLPGAADELDAVVGHTEQATNTIFAAVEAIEAALPEMPPETAARVTAAVTRIYEACSFQDITGQRITKVMRALREVQRRVGSLLVGFGDGQPALAAGGQGAPAGAPPLTSQADVDALLVGAAARPAGGGACRRDGEVALHGPQLPRHAPGQADIDALLGGPA